MIGHSINHDCYKCLCRVCGAVGCPHKAHGYPSRCAARCWTCFGDNKPHPILDCDFFYFKQLHKFRIRRIYRIPEIRYVDKTNADDIRVMLTEILRILNADGADAAPDVNCVRNNCICLSCPVKDRCSDRCSRCRDYKGQYPVKLCARRLQFLKQCDIMENRK